MSINCQDHAVEHGRTVCRAGVYPGPSAGTCKYCKSRRPIEAGPAGLTIAGRPRQSNAAAVPRDEWPKWASWLAERASDADAGVGDTANRLLGKGGAAFKATLRALGIPCGCDSRRAAWNAMYPYR